MIVHGEVEVKKEIHFPNSISIDEVKLVMQKHTQVIYGADLGPSDIDKVRNALADGLANNLLQHIHIESVQGYKGMAFEASLQTLVPESVDNYQRTLTKTQEACSNTVKDLEDQLIRVRVDALETQEACEKEVTELKRVTNRETVGYIALYLATLTYVTIMLHQVGAI